MQNGNPWPPRAGASVVLACKRKIRSPVFAAQCEQLLFCLFLCFIYRQPVIWTSATRTNAPWALYTWLTKISVLFCTHKCVRSPLHIVCNDLIFSHASRCDAAILLLIGRKFDTLSCRRVRHDWPVSAEGLCRYFFLQFAGEFFNPNRSSVHAIGIVDIDCILAFLLA